MLLFFFLPFPGNEKVAQDHVPGCYLPCPHSSFHVFDIHSSPGATSPERGGAGPASEEGGCKKENTLRCVLAAITATRV